MEIIIAVSDLTNEHWAKQFFPEDLPKDWQIDYYANEFSALLSADETITLSAREDFLYVLENVACDTIQVNSACQVVTVVFPSTKPVEICSGIALSLAELTSQQNITETVCILRVTSDRMAENKELKTLLVHIRSNYSQFDRVCLFLNRSMQNSDVINTCKIINDLL